MVIFITSYTEQYLESKYVGRYLITSYCAGQLLFRVIRAAWTWRDDSEMMAFRSLVVGYMVCFGMLVLWILTSIEYQHSVLFVVFGVSGFVLSGSYPLVLELCESVTPIKGRNSCIFSICCGGGDIAVTMLVGSIVDKYGIRRQPILLLFVCVLQITVIVVTRNVFRHYKDFQFAVMASGPRMQHKTNAV